MALALARTIAAVTATNLNTATTAAFSPAAGEVLVMIGITEAGDRSFGTLSSSPSQTWTLRVQANSAGVIGNTRVYIWTATVGSAPGSTTVSATATGSNGTRILQGSGWSGAQLAATPATHLLVGSTTVSDTITTAANGSVVVWGDGDWNSVSGTATYRSSATQLSLTQIAACSAYTAWQSAASAGSQTYGMTAPTGQLATMAAIEIQDSSGGAVVTPQSHFPSPARFRASVY